MREHVKAAEPFVREDVPVGAGARALPRRAPGLQGRADRRPRRRGDRRAPLETVSLYTNGPFTDLCRGPHAPEHGDRQGVQAAARSRAPTGAATPTRTMLTRIYGTAFFSKAELERAPRAPRAGAGARPPQARPRARPVHVLRALARAARSGCRPGWRSGTRCTELWREREPQPRLQRGQDADPLRRRAVEALGPLGQVPRQHVLHRGRGARDGAQADELPGAHPALRDERRSYRDLPIRYSEPGLVHRHEPSGVLHGLLRVRHFTQDDAHIFCTEEQVQEEVVQCLRFGFDLTRCSASSRAWSSRRAPSKRIGNDEMWDRAEGALAGRARGRGPRLRAQPRRRRLLRAEDRPAHDRLARALLAARHRPARLLDAGALRPRLHRRRQRRAPPGDDPPRAARLLRALHRHPDRALRRRVPAVARAGAGDRAAGLRPLQRLRRGGRAQQLRARRRCASSSTTAASRSGARSARPSCARSPTCSSSASARQDERGAVSVRAHRGGRRRRRDRRRCAAQFAASA